MLGKLRVSNAYEFYCGVRDHCTWKEKDWEKNPKPPFEATNYILYYFAANAQDAVGKDCDFVLDRTEMWDNTQVPGCSSAYDFVGMPGSTLCMRALPCACAFCCANRYEQCTNRFYVGSFREVALSVVEINCPEFLQLPLETNRLCTINVLKAFMRRHQKAIPARVTRRDDIIRLVMQELRDYLLDPINNNAEA